MVLLSDWRSALVLRTTSTSTPVSGTSPSFPTVTAKVGSSAPVRTTFPPEYSGFPATLTAVTRTPCRAFGSVLAVPDTGAVSKPSAP
jgi:hypothetical protein